VQRRRPFALRRQHVDCRVARADAPWPHEVALEPAKGAKEGTQFGKDLPCGMAREFSLAAFEGIMLMCVRARPEFLLCALCVICAPG